MTLLNKVKVVVLDCYGTLVGYGVPAGEKQTARKGLFEFLNRMEQNGIELVIATDDHDPMRVWRLLDEIGVASYFVDYSKTTTSKFHAFQFYGFDTMNFDKHKHGDKDFARIAEDFGVRLDEVYFIGDNGVGRDKRSAERYGVKWTNCDQFHPFATFGNEFDFNNILPESFEWDDEKVKKFTRIYAMGQKGQFYGYPKIDDKLDRFKELDQRGDRS